MPHLVLSLVGIKDKSAGKLVLHPPTEENIRDTRATDFLISNKDGEKVTCEVYLCNMALNFILGSNKPDDVFKLPDLIPVMHIFVTRSRAMFHDMLFDIWLNFHPESEPGNLKSFINQEIKGYYSSSLCINGSKYALQDKIAIYPGNQKVMDMFNTVLKTENMQQMIRKQTELIMHNKRLKYGLEREESEEEDEDGEKKDGEKEEKKIET
jgi:hypothetical protein